MDSITQLIVQQIAGPAVRQIAQRMGVSESTAEHAVRLAVPLLVAALARNAAQPQGAQALQQAVAISNTRVAVTTQLNRSCARGSCSVCSASIWRQPSAAENFPATMLANAPSS